MSTKRLITALAATAIGLAVLAGCAPTSDPTPTTSSTPTPTSTGAAPVDPPKTEEEAVTAAEKTINQVLKLQGEINAQGGVDPSPYEAIVTGPALKIYNEDAYRIAHGPLANEEGKNVEGQAKTEGAIKIEVKSAYGQEREGIQNGLVIVLACEDISEYKVTTADGKPGYRPDSDRTQVEYHTVYDTEHKAWMLYDRINLRTPC